MLQRVFIEKNINSLNLSKFCDKSNCPQCLVVLRFQHDPKPFKRFSIAFCVSSRKSKSRLATSRPHEFQGRILNK